MRHHRKAYHCIFPAICLILLAANGCGRREEPRTVVPTPKPREIAATVSFLKGEAKAFSLSAWKPLAIGLELEAADSLDLAAACQAELRDTAGKTAKLAGPARGTVSELMAAAAAARTGTTGKVLTKIRKLEGTKQTYSTQTPTAVAGIRGTQSRAVVPDSSKRDSLRQ